MLREAGAEYVLTGHSERRALFGETDETVAKRTVAALKEGLKVVMCVGETLEQRESGLTEKVLEKQLREGLKYVDADMMSAVSVAYEPVWAIGTGKTASAEQARDAIACLRGVLGGIFDAATAESTYILYGGSMNEKNAFSLLSMKGVDGGLIGGASLDAEKFISIIKAYDNTERKI
jgi:triosephosphate isomerase